ncbi:hypothetical protein [Paraclostridium sordellii]|uniref:hypothetical protein n=1 Tax=Paraclostridium sordellii TaxID=1505 RepID=UPI0005DDD7FA|nr:hypothetical protein [Paeniclostridium sordellii]CEN21236.1 Uncharacterised protein [[Clostridium] sordellii] [Paeniclostridium sordellii]
MKKRLSLDLDLDNYNDRKIWEYLETKKVKSKAIKSILNAFLDGTEIPRENILTQTNENLKKGTNENIIDLKKSEVDPTVIEGF